MPSGRTFLPFSPSCLSSLTVISGLVPLPFPRVPSDTPKNLFSTSLFWFSRTFFPPVPFFSGSPCLFRVDVPTFGSVGGDLST